MKIKIKFFKSKLKLKIKSLVLDVHVNSSDCIVHVFNDALSLSKELNLKVRFKHNDILCIVSPHSDLKTFLDDYYNHITKGGRAHVEN